MCSAGNLCRGGGRFREFGPEDAGCFCKLRQLSGHPLIPSNRYPPRRQCRSRGTGGAGCGLPGRSSCRPARGGPGQRQRQGQPRNAAAVSPGFCPQGKNPNGSAAGTPPAFSQGFGSQRWRILPGASRSFAATALRPRLPDVFSPQYLSPACPAAPPSAPYLPSIQPCFIFLQPAVLIIGRPQAGIHR